MADNKHRSLNFQRYDLKVVELQIERLRLEKSRFLREFLLRQNEEELRGAIKARDYYATYRKPRDDDDSNTGRLFHGCFVGLCILAAIGFVLFVLLVVLIAHLS